ncbi:MAG: low specificity L-threonine aldolase [Firmicutes bacterium]|nr:low specificity L-threonine aldolase [Bacillota bacterium]
MVYFECDYTEGALPEILQRLHDTNFEQTLGYGEDEHCARAAQLIKSACGVSDADVHFLVGGTQTNSTVINSILRPHQGVIACSSGHINVHETGAIEACGHKVLAVCGEDGKITAAQADDMISGHFADPTAEHMVQPGMVYISFPTETGTIYSKAELAAIKQVCGRHGVPLFIDGARLGYGLMAESCDVTLHDIAELSDVFYIGGTKVGALFGEAVVITNNNLKKDFRYIMKQHGAMLAKGRILGIQFEVLFEKDEDNGNIRYFNAAKHGIDQAMRIREAFKSAGAEMSGKSVTNQQFVILNEKQINKLSEKYGFEVWESVKENSYLCRFCTSWASKAENVDKLIADIKIIF